MVSYVLNICDFDSCVVSFQIVFPVPSRMCQTFLSLAAGISAQQDGLADLFTFDALTLQWSNLSSKVISSTQPQARSYHGMAAAGNVLFVFGGLGEKGEFIVKRIVESQDSQKINTSDNATKSKRAPFFTPGSICAPT